VCAFRKQYLSFASLKFERFFVFLDSDQKWKILNKKCCCCFWNWRCSIKKIWASFFETFLKAFESEWWKLKFWFHTGKEELQIALFSGGYLFLKACCWYSLYKLLAFLKNQKCNSISFVKINNKGLFQIVWEKHGKKV
jgi:hypothetical protein